MRKHNLAVAFWKHNVAETAQIMVPISGRSAKHKLATGTSQRVFEKSCQFQLHRICYRLSGSWSDHILNDLTGVDFSNTLLEQEGKIERTPGRGTIVRQPRL